MGDKGEHEGRVKISKNGWRHVWMAPIEKKGLCHKGSIFMWSYQQKKESEHLLNKTFVLLHILFMSI